MATVGSDGAIRGPGRVDKKHDFEGRRDVLAGMVCDCGLDRMGGVVRGEWTRIWM